MDKQDEQDIFTLYYHIILSSLFIHVNFLKSKA